MRIAIISDIHGNCFALEVALADIRRAAVDQVVCLGDAIQGGPQPADVVSRLRELGCPVVLGNADAWLLSGEETGADPIAPERLRKMQDIRAWSLAQLSAEDQAFIAQFQPTVRVPVGAGRDLLCFHGSPASFDEIILPTTSEEEFQRILGAHAPHILTGGHTHLQQLRRIGATDGFFFNPGAVGLAYSHQQPDERFLFHADPWAEYAILTADAGRLGLEFRRVPVDVQLRLGVYQSSGRPHAADALAQYQ